MNFLNGAMYSINAAALLIGAAGLLSRLLGVLRDRLLASSFGASRELDIYYAAFQIPDLLYTMLLLGAASAAVIPVFLELKGRSHTEVEDFMQKLIAFVSLGSIVVSGIAFFAMPFLARAIAPGFSPAEFETLVTLSRIMLLSPLFLGLSSILSSAIQSARLFAVYALTGIMYNAGIIIGILFFIPSFGLVGLAMGVSLGACLHFVVQIPSFYRLGFRFPPFTRFVSFARYALKERAVRNVVAVSFPRIIALSLRQVTFITYVAIASTLLSGSISVLQFAYNLQYIPVGIFGLSFAVAAFPQLAEQWLARTGEKWVHTFAASLRTIIFWVAPLSVLFYVLRAQIVRVALGGGRFDWGDTILTAAVFGVFSTAIVAEAVIPLLMRSFYSLGNTRTPLYTAFVTSFLSVASALFMVLLFQYGPAELLDFLRNFLKVGNQEGIAVIGLSWAFAIGGFFQAIILFLFLVREVRERFGESLLASVHWEEFFRIGWVSILAGIAAFGTLRTVNTFISLDTFFGVFAQGISAFIGAAVVYIGTLYLFGNKEVGELVSTVRRRMFRRSVLPKELDPEHARENQ